MKAKSLSEAPARASAPERRGADSPLREPPNLLRFTQLQTMLSLVPSAIAYVSIDRHWRFINDAGAAILGLPRERIVGSPLMDVYQFAKPGPFIAALDQLFETGESQEYESHASVANAVVQRWTLVRLTPDRAENGALVGAFVVASDLNEDRQAELVARSQKELVEQHLDNGIIAFVQLSLDYKIERWSASAARIFGWSAKEAIGEYVGELGMVCREDFRTAMTAGKEARDNKSSVGSYHRSRNITKAGREIWCDWYSTVAKDRNTGLDSMLCFAIDVTERVGAKISLTRAAEQDTLTGLPNRHAFYEWFDGKLAKGGLHGKLFFIDLDGFKEVNDRYGHETGDKLLVQVAEHLRESLGDIAFLARYGGDEFVAFVSKDKSSEGTQLLANRVTKALRGPFEIGDLSVDLSCSVGIVNVPEHGSDANELVKFADLAMYRAKQNGKDQHAVFTEDVGQGHQLRGELYAGLRDALRNDHFKVYFQPRVSVQTGEVVGAEALARWQTSPGHYVSPAQFIPVAEETGLIHELGVVVLHDACELAYSVNAGRKDNQTPFIVSVNVSALQLRYHRFVEQTEVILERTGCSPQWIEFEITESRAITEPDSLERLRELVIRVGIRCALDDFGTGYSNLGELTILPISALKIDRAFISALSPHNAAVVSAILALGKSLMLEAVAEGVETPSQLAQLKLMGCETYQGFLHSQAMPRHELEARFLRAPAQGE
jgi:diguanylate cyclase (GGDEF)-like protein/PAS domain S-box-containing protein